MGPEKDRASKAGSQGGESNAAAGGHGAATDSGLVAGESAAALVSEPGAEEVVADLEQLREKARERDAFLELLQRTRADFENYQKRKQREMEAERRYAVLPLVRDLLPVLDNIQRALEASRSSPEAGQLAEGVGLVARQLEEVLGRHAVRPLEVVGQLLDPHRHEVVAQETSSEHPPQTVLRELERGYQLHDRVVRPAKVVVAQALTANGDGEAKPGGINKETSVSS